MTTPVLDAPLDTPLGTAVVATSPAVPGQYEVAIAGHPYMVDHANDLNGFRGTHFTRKSIPILRAQADTANIPGEQSLNRDADWRRAMESWEHGSGQLYADRTTSDSSRFRASKGVYCWDKWSLSLLNDTSLQRASASTNLRLTACGTYTYLADGNNLLFTADITANPVVWTTVTGTPASPCLWVTTDGQSVYAAYGGSGVYSTTRGAASAASYNTQACTILAFVKGRLMAGNANVLYNITAPTGVGSVTTLLTQSNTDFVWTGFAESPGFIQCAGYSGNRSLIYKVTIQSDATALASPVVSGELPTGETVRTIKGYLGSVVIGTDLGVRYATVSSQGDLTVGALIPLPLPVYNFEPADRFIWFGWSNYDSTSTGLGRLTPTVFTDNLVPAYASDVMASAQGTVLSISTQGSRRVFTVSGVGVFVEGTAKVPSGTLQSGRVAFGIGDSKVATYVDLRTAPLTGSVNVSLAVDGGTAAPVGSSTVQGSTRPPNPLNALQQRGEFFEITITLNRDGTTFLSPQVTRVLLRAFPAPSRAFNFVVPLLMHGPMLDVNGNPIDTDVLAQRAFLEGLLRSQQIVTYQEGNTSYQVLVDDLIWVPIKTTGPPKFTYEGTQVVLMKEIVSS